jgi:predicted nuclease of predicted toxin-antitoxin system
LKGLLLDENLPYRPCFPVELPMIHSTDLGNSVSDSDLWNYSKENGLVIVAKDADFSDRMAVADPPPWVIHVRFGNVRAAARSCG